MTLGTRFGVSSLTQRASKNPYGVLRIRESLQAHHLADSRSSTFLRQTHRDSDQTDFTVTQVRLARCDLGSCSRSTPFFISASIPSRSISLEI